MNERESNYILTAIDAAKPRARSEPELRAIIVQALRASGIAIEEQLACAAGTADLVTVRRDAVLEVKLELSRKAIQWAVGQVLLYRAAINPAARAIVVGYATDETASLVDWAAAVGVEVICWAEDEGLRTELVSPPSSRSLQPFTLRWNVQSLAHSHGIRRVADLARFLSLPRQGLYGAWRGTAVGISLVRLERLAQRLGPTPEDWLRPGAWFHWSNGRLCWAVHLVAEQAGLDAAQLAFRAGLYPQQLGWYYSGEAQFMYIESLARLAAALETEAQLFDVGEVFSRAEF